MASPNSRRDMSGFSTRRRAASRRSSGQKLQPAPRLDFTHGLDVYRRRGHRLVDVGAFAVGDAVGVVADVLDHLDAHQLEGGVRRAHEGQAVLDLLAFLEIDDVRPLAADVLGAETQFPQKGEQIPGQVIIGDAEFQVIPGFGIAHRAAGEEGPRATGRRDSRRTPGWRG